MTNEREQPGSVQYLEETKEARQRQRERETRARVEKKLYK